MMLTQKQQRIFDWLNKKLQRPVFAEAYKGALDLLDKKSSGYITFVSHTGRDLMNTLARSVQGINTEHVQYKALVDKFQHEWKSEWGTEGFNKMDCVENGHLIPYQTCKKIKKLIDEHKAVRLKASEADYIFFSTFLDYKDRDKIPQNFIKEWKTAKKWFLKHAHLREKAFSQDAPSKVRRHFLQTLDSYLYIAASSTLERIKGVNEILEETNQ